MITYKQYKKALLIIEAYKKQCLDNVAKKTFTLSDLVALDGTIQVPYLSHKIVDEDFAANIEEKLLINGHVCKFVSLDDMGFISISFFDGKTSDERIALILDILNGVI